MDTEKLIKDASQTTSQGRKKPNYCKYTPFNSRILQDKYFDLASMRRTGFVWAKK